MLRSIILAYKRSPDREPLEFGVPEYQRDFAYKKWSSFVTITLGYGVFYTTRLSLNVAKKPLIDEGVFDPSEMGNIGSALFLAYAFGKLINGILADRANVRRFMATGLLVSAVANLLLGFTTWFWAFLILWGINGWSQSTGSPASVVSLSHWFGNKDRGTFYGIWSASHNLGSAFTYIATAFVVSTFGWTWGFRLVGMFAIGASVLIWHFLYERPQVYGFRSPVSSKPEGEERKSIGTLQLQIVRNPAVWTLALASAFMYITRYAVDSWGIFFLTTEKGYSLPQASTIISVSSVCGIAGTVGSGLFSDRLFAGRRNVPALIFGIVYTIAIVLFVLGPAHVAVDVLSMVLFGLALGVLLCYLGGLMAVDICPKDAAGTALGMVGIASYLGAALQDVLSGYFIESGATTIDGVTSYDFTKARLLWIGAAVLSMILTTLVWNAKADE